MTRSFAVSFDYRCPFARNAQESVVSGIRQGKDWDVTFVPFSLDQVHVEEGEPPVWERPPGERGSGVLALEYGLAVRDAFPDHFLDAHIALFAARHDHGEKLADEDVLRKAMTSVDLDADAVAAEVASGRPLATLAREHTDAVQALGDVRRPDVLRRRSGRVRPVDGTRHRRTTSTRSSTSSRSSA